MKKILFLLLLSISAFGQVSTGQEQEFDYGIKNNSTQTVITPDYLTTTGTDGTYGKVLPINLPINLATIDSLKLKPYFSTGLLKNGLLTINADNTKFNLSAGIGVYSDFSDPENVTSKVFNFPEFNAVLSPYLTTSNITYVAVNYNGGSPVLVMQASKFSNTQLRDLVVVGAVIHSNFTTINVINNISSPSNDVGNSVADLFNFLGARNQEGNVYSANGANLQLNKSAGVMLKYGANFHVNAKNPHNVSLPEQLSLTFRYRLRGGFEGTDRINIDTDNYDLNNVLTTVPPAKPYQIQTIFIPQTGQTRLQYGQDTYSTLADAIAAINTRKFVTETNLASQFVKVAYLVVKKGATSLNAAADADIRQATQFDGTASGGVALTYQSIIDALNYEPENVVNKVTDIAVGANNTTYPTSLAAKTYADNLVVGMLNDRGSWDASVNLFPTTGGSGAAGAIRKGDMWYVSIVGVLGGKSVNVGDSFRALVNSPAQVASNWSVLESNIGYIPANDLDVVHKTGNESINGLKSFSSRIQMGDGVEFTGGVTPNSFSNSYISKDPETKHIWMNTGGKYPYIFNGNLLNTASRTYTFPNQSGTFALTSDLSAYEPIISPKNSAFNKNFGTTAGTVVEGNYPPAKDGTGATGTWGINISGSSVKWNGYENVFSAGNQGGTIGGIVGLRTSDNAILTYNKTAVQAFTGINDGSTLTNNITGNANSANNWGGRSANLLVNGGDLYYGLGIDGNDGVAKFFDASKWKTFLGLGSNAYTSTAYLPLSGGTITGFTKWNNSVIKFQTSGTDISLLSTTYQITDSGSTTDFNTYVYGSNPYGIWTNGLRRVTVGGNGNVTFTGTITASPATVDTELATLGQAKAVARPYKVYTALLSQSGTDAPVATVLENTLGGTVVWSRNIAGDYSGTLTGAFVNNKTTIDISSGINTSSYSRTCEVISSSEVKIYTYQGGVNTDGLMGNNYTSIEIRVYN